MNERTSFLKNGLRHILWIALLSAASSFKISAEPVIDLIVQASGDGETWQYTTQFFGDATDVSGIITLKRQTEDNLLKSAKIDNFSPGKSVSGLVDLRPYGTGTYELEIIAISNGKGLAKAQKDLYYLEAPWRNIDLDKCEVIEPWTPVEVKDTTVSVWGRSYTMDKNALPKSMTSSGRELLASPVAVSAKIDDTPCQWTFSAPQMVKKEDGSAIFTGRGESSGARNISLKTTTTTEFDGLAMIDLSIEGKDISRISDLQIIIPVSGDIAHYIYRTGEDRLWIFGQVGVRAKPGTVLRVPFMPFAWIGNDDMGLFWFCDTNTAWPLSLSGSADAITIVDTGNSVELRLKILGDGEKLEKPWNFRFGLMATPVRPGGNGTTRPRGWSISATENKNLSLEWPFPKVFYDACIPDPVNPEDMKKKIKISRDNGLIPMPYTAYSLPATIPAWDVYGRQWHLDGTMDMFWGEATTFHPGPEEDGAWMAMCPTSEANKWLTWKIASIIDEYGWQGYYRDGIYYPSCANRLHNHGIGGSYQYHMESLRKHYRYLYTHVHKNNPGKGWVFFHSSGIIPVPLLAYCDSYALAEDLNGVNSKNGDYRQMLNLDQYRSMIMGRAWGLTSVFIPQLRGEYINARNTRTLMAFLLLHDIGIWGSNSDLRVIKSIEDATMRKFGFSGADYLGYFREDTPAKAVGKDIHVTLYRRTDGRTMAVVANLAYKNLRTRVTFQPEKLGLTKIGRCRDLEHDFDFPVVDNSVQVVVREGDFRLLEIR